MNSANSRANVRSKSSRKVRKTLGGSSQGLQTYPTMRFHSCPQQKIHLLPSLHQQNQLLLFSHHLQSQPAHLSHHSQSPFRRSLTSASRQLRVRIKSVRQCQEARILKTTILIALKSKAQSPNSLLLRRMSL